MEFNFAKKQAARNGRNKIIQAVLLITAVVLVRLFVFQGSVVNEFGPYAGFQSSIQLDGLYESRQYYVTTQAEYMFHTDYVMTQDGRERWNYFALQAGEQYLLCRMPLSYGEAEYAGLTLKGKLREFDSDESQVRTGVISDIADAWETTRTEAAEYVSPYILYVDENRFFDQAAVVIEAALLALGLYWIIRAVRGMVDPGSTKSFMNLVKKYGYDPARMNEGISADIAGGRVLYENKWVVVTENWVGDKKGSTFAIYPKADVVWVFRTVTQHRTNGIPSGKSHTVNLATDKGAAVVVTAKNEKDASDIVDKLSNCGFTAVFGFTPELQSLYNGNRPQFIALAREQTPPTAPPAQQADPMGTQPAAPAQPVQNGYSSPSGYTGPEL